MKISIKTYPEQGGTNQAVEFIIVIKLTAEIHNEPHFSKLRYNLSSTYFLYDFCVLTGIRVTVTVPGFSVVADCRSGQFDRRRNFGLWPIFPGFLVKRSPPW